MGLLGTFFSNAEDLYKEAFQKGVLLGRSSFSSASQIFEKAATKARKEGDLQLANRAAVNALLYGYLSSGSYAQLKQLAQALRSVDQLEAIGSSAAQMPVQQLLKEVEVRLSEYEILGEMRGSDQLALSRKYEALAALFTGLLNQKLYTYAFQPDANPMGDPERRSKFYLGKAALHQARAVQMSNPVEATKCLAAARLNFSACNLEEEAANASQVQSKLAITRVCWACHREHQGEGLHFDYYPASVTGYAMTVLTQSKGDPTTLDLERQTIALCRTCASAVTNLADKQAIRRTDELNIEISKQIRALTEEINSLKHQVLILKTRG